MDVAYKIKLKDHKAIKFTKSKRFRLALQIFLVLIITFNVGNVLWSLKDRYFSTDYWQRFPALMKTYLNSQYVNKHPKGWIPDETVNAYAGGKYIKGENPVLIAADTPPLGRYLIGLSALAFGNENIVILFSAVLSLILMYVLGRQIFASGVLSLIPPLLFSFEPIFKNQLIYTPLLDIIQLVFLLASFILFNRSLSSKTSYMYLLSANIMLGCFIATKFFITGLTIIGAFYLVLLVKKDKNRLWELTLTLPVSIIILLVSYVRVFAFGYSIHSFLGIQKWVFLYHKSQLILPFSIWPLILFNRWYVWYGNNPVIRDAQWIISWPLVTLLSISTFVLGIVRKIKLNENIRVLIAWIVLYFGFFSFGQITSRYFVILIPVLYIISLYGLIEIYKIYKK